MTDSLLSEVDADLRAERIAQLWMKYRFKLLFAVAAIIVATAASTAWENYQQKRGGEMLLAFTNAQKLYGDKKMDEAAAGFADVAKKASGNVQTLAYIWQSRALVAADKKPEAVEVLKLASAGKTGLWSDLACLRLASLDTDAASLCLADKKDSPLANQRREWQAANLWAAGKKDDATALLEQLQTSPDTSEATRALTDQWLATMRAESAAK